VLATLLSAIPRGSMNIKRFLFALILVVITLQSANFPLSAQPAAQAKKWKVALVLPGSINDKGFNESGFNGLMLIKEKLGVEVAYAESTPAANFERVIRGFAEDGSDVIIGHGFEFGDVMTKVSKDYPDQFFLVTNHPDLSGPNLASIQPASKDSAFLVGVVAGLTTKTNKIGAVLGFDFPVIIGQVEAFRLAIKSVNPKAELQTVYVGTFDDPAKGKEAALAQISAGADVIYHIADTAGVGAIQAADSKGVKAIGWGVDQNPIAPKTVIVTQVVDTGDMVLEEVKAIIDGKFDGKAKTFGLDTLVVGISDYHGLVPDDVAAQVDQWKQAIISGGVTIPMITDRDGAKKLDPLTLRMGSATPDAASATVTK
jgi:basic membrane protein A and related proteins